MAKNLGQTVIAEGVEMQPQKTLLQAMGCHRFQGYLFSKPLPLAQFEASLQAGMAVLPGIEIAGGVGAAKAAGH
jgi:diguanylate cyclase